MKFKVQSGDHTKSVEALDFNHAANVFLTLLLEEEPEPELGLAISVTAEVTESFILTNDVLKDLDQNHILKLYPDLRIAQDTYACKSKTG